MRKKTILLIAALIIPIFLLTYCNLPKRTAPQSQIPTSTMGTRETIHTPSPVKTPTVMNTPTTTASLCDNQYQPSQPGNQWTYSGSNTPSGNYIRTERVINPGENAFSIESEISGISSTVDYTCTSAGLVAANPIEQYLGTFLSIPGNQLNVTLLSASGVTLPAMINPGDTWQQTAEWDAMTTETTISGVSVIDYSAAGYENVTVPYGTFNALRVDATITTQVSILRIPVGTYVVTRWYVPDIGIVKSEGTSHITGVDFSDSMVLTGYTDSP